MRPTSASRCSCSGWAWSSTHSAAAAWATSSADFLPAGDTLPDLLLLALVATVLANLVNNLPATLLLVPLAAPLGTVAVLATLVGLNVGSSLTWTGSLANLLWRRTLTRAGVRVSGRRFHAIAALAVPPAVALGVVAVWAWAGVVL